MIYLLGDVHGRFDHILPAIERDNPDTATVIFLGDIEAPQPFEVVIRPLLDAGVGVWFIHGNHDTDSHASWSNLSDAQARNLNGKVVEVEGMAVAGLGGIFRSEIWYPRRANSPRNKAAVHSYEDYVQALTQKAPKRLRGAVSGTSRALKHRSSIFPNVYDHLAQQKADILVTHEAPSCHRHGFEALDSLVHTMGVKQIFHGHQHEHLGYPDAPERYGFSAHGVGLRGIVDITGRCVLIGEPD